MLLIIYIININETRRKHTYNAKVSKLDKEIRDEVDTDSKGNLITSLFSFGSKDKSKKKNNLEVEPTKISYISHIIYHMQW